MTESLLDGRFVGFDVARLTESQRALSEAIDTTTGEMVVLKSFMITSIKAHENAKEEAEFLRQLGKFFRLPKK